MHYFIHNVLTLYLTKYLLISTSILNISICILINYIQNQYFLNQIIILKKYILIIMLSNFNKPNFIPNSYPNISLNSSIIFLTY